MNYIGKTLFGVSVTSLIILAVCLVTTFIIIHDWITDNKRKR